MVKKKTIKYFILLLIANIDYLLRQEHSSKRQVRRGVELLITG